MSSERKLRVMSWNSNGLKTKIEKVKNELEKQNCDVVFLQQTRSGESDILEMLEDYDSIFYTTQTSNITGVAILIKTKTGYTIEEDPAGCYIVVKCTLKGQLFTLVSVYNCQSNIKPLIKLRSVLEKHAEGILLIGGDFNVPLNPYLDRTSTKKNKNHSLLKPAVEELITSFHLVDVWRRLHPKDRKFSYQQEDVKSRLDYIFVPEESMHYIEDCYISQDECYSDHYPVVSEISLSKEERKKTLVVPVRINKQNKVPVLRVQKKVQDKWLSCKLKYWPNLTLIVNPHKPLMISTSEVEQAIQSLVVNQVERPDGLSLSFYKSNSYVLIPYLCVFYHNVLEQPTNIPEAFNETYKVSETHHIFNVDYLILATIMARWLYEHLQSHSADYTVGDNKKTVLFTFKKTLIVLKWSDLHELLYKEQTETEPTLLDTFRIAALHMILKKSPSGKQRLLHWGCPLTPVLMTLYLKHVANEMVKNVGDKRPSIYISRENVIVRFSKQFDLSELEGLKKIYTKVDCTPLELFPEQTIFPDEALSVEL